MTPGLWLYLDSFDMREVDASIATLRDCGAVGALVLIESVDRRRQPVSRVVEVCKRLRDHDIAPILYAFPDVTGDLTSSLTHYAKCHVATGAPGQLDAEPHAGTHWQPSTLAPWLRFDRALSITSTRAEAPHMGTHGRQLWLQAEAQTSTLHLAKSLKTWPDAIVVTGAFGSTNDPRTLLDVRTDLARCQPQARRTGAHAVWSAHALERRPDLRAELRSWAVETWPPG